MHRPRRKPCNVPPHLPDNPPRTAAGPPFPLHSSLPGPAFSPPLPPRACPVRLDIHNIEKYFITQHIDKQP